MLKRKSFEVLFHVTGNCQRTKTVYFNMKTCYYYLLLRPLWGQTSTFLLEPKRVCWQDEKEGKANLFCSFFIDSSFTDVVPVITIKSNTFAAVSVFPKESARSLCRGINTQLENSACFSIFISADTKTAKPTDSGAGASRSDREPPVKDNSTIGNI